MNVSVGIPFLNPGPAFLKAIRSVFAQSTDDWELILVDDGSTDESLEWARAISDPRVRLLSDGRNLGLCARLNQIANIARFELLCRMDADDVMHPDRLRKQRQWMMIDPSIDVLGTTAVAIDDRDEITCMLGRPFDEAGVERAALTSSIFVHDSVIGKRDWFRTHPYDPEYVRAEDHELWVRAAGRSHYAFRADALMYYRQPRRLNLAAYVATCRTDRKIVRRYGPGLVGWGRTSALLARSAAFELVHRALAGLDWTEWLMKLRGQTVPAEARQHHESALRRALSAHVPGWPPASYQDDHQRVPSVRGQHG